MFQPVYAQTASGFPLTESFLVVQLLVSRSLISCSIFLSFEIVLCHGSVVTVSGIFGAQQCWMCAVFLFSDHLPARKTA
jgi:hypothetical protein